MVILHIWLYWFSSNFFKKPMDGVQLSQGYRATARGHGHMEYMVIWSLDNMLFLISIDMWKKHKILTFSSNYLIIVIGMFINIRHNRAFQENSKKVFCEQLLRTWTLGIEISYTEGTMVTQILLHHHLQFSLRVALC